MIISLESLLHTPIPARTKPAITRAVEALRQVPLFADLEQVGLSLKDLIQLSKLRNFRSDTRLWIPDHSLVLLRGEAAVFIKSEISRNVNEEDGFKGKRPPTTQPSVAQLIDKNDFSKRKKVFLSKWSMTNVNIHRSPEISSSIILSEEPYVKKIEKQIEIPEKEFLITKGYGVNLIKLLHDHHIFNPTDNHLKVSYLRNMEIDEIYHCFEFKNEQKDSMLRIINQKMKTKSGYQLKIASFREFEEVKDPNKTQQNDSLDLEDEIQETDNKIMNIQNIILTKSEVTVLLIKKAYFNKFLGLRKIYERNQRIKHIGKIFPDLSRFFIEQHEKNFESHTFMKGSKIYSKGDPTRSFYFIEKGNINQRLKLTQRMKTGEKLVKKGLNSLDLPLMDQYSGETIGLVEFMNGTSRISDAIAASETVTLLEIPRKLYYRIISSSPMFQVRYKSLSNQKNEVLVNRIQSILQNIQPKYWAQEQEKLILGNLQKKNKNETSKNVISLGKTIKNTWITKERKIKNKVRRTHYQKQQYINLKQNQKNNVQLSKQTIELLKSFKSAVAVGKEDYKYSFLEKNSFEKLQQGQTKKKRPKIQNRDKFSFNLTIKQIVEASPSILNVDTEDKHSPLKVNYFLMSPSVREKKKRSQTNLLNKKYRDSEINQQSMKVEKGTDTSSAIKQQRSSHKKENYLRILSQSSSNKQNVFGDDKLIGITNQINKITGRSEVRKITKRIKENNKISNERTPSSSDKYHKRSNSNWIPSKKNKFELKVKIDPKLKQLKERRRDNKAKSLDYIKSTSTVLSVLEKGSYHLKLFKNRISSSSKSQLPLKKSLKSSPQGLKISNCRSFSLNSPENMPRSRGRPMTCTPFTSSLVSNSKKNYQNPSLFIKRRAWRPNLRSSLKKSLISP